MFYRKYASPLRRWVRASTNQRRRHSSIVGDDTIVSPLSQQLDSATHDVDPLRRHSDYVLSTACIHGSPEMAVIA